MSYVIASIIGIVLFTFACIKVMDGLFGKRNASTIVLLLSCVPFLISSIGPKLLFTIHPIAQILLQLLSLFLITLNYKSIITKRFAIVGTIFVMMNVIDNLYGLFFILFPKIQLKDWTVSIISLIIKIIVFFIAAFLFRLVKANKKVDEIPAIWVPTVVISGTALLFGILYFAETSHIQEIMIVLMWCAALFLTFYLRYILSVVFEEKLKSALHYQEKEYYLAQCQLMQESVEGVKSIRHDIKKHLTTLKDYTQQNKAATDYLDSLLEDVGESEIYSDTGNIAFDSVINYKLRDAKKDNIKFDLRILVPPVINVEVADIVTILGNLLDNAIEAVAKINEKAIKMDIEFGRGSLFIKIENSFNGEIKSSEKNTDDEKQLISLKSGYDHGYGLKNVRHSIEKYNGYMKITTIENVFSVGVFLYVDNIETSNLS